MNRKIKLKDLIRDILREDHGLGYGHNSTSDYGDVQFVRDPLNDPLLTDKNESVLPIEFGLNNKQSRKFWMDKSGDIYGTQQLNHPQWAEKYLEYIGEYIPNHVSGAMFNKGWVKMLLGFGDGNVYTLFYETKSKATPLTEKQNKSMRDFAIEARVDVIKDRNGNSETLNENYNFRDFAWLSTMDGFNQPTDVLYGTVHLGVIASKPEGYVILTIDGPHGLIDVKLDDKNIFKTKNLAAAMLHTMWKLERQG